MDRSDAGLAEWQMCLRRAAEELHEREERALADDPAPGEMLALAAERDRIADERDTVAEVFDERAVARDRAGLQRDVAGSGRDRTARTAHEDADPAWAYRSLAGEDRDYAAGDRGDSFDDRARSQRSRARAAADRDRAAVDRERAAEETIEQERQVVDLQTALETRLIIGRAEGLLMERHNISAEAAFAVLVRFSQESNRKLREVATEVVVTAEHKAQR